MASAARRSASPRAPPPRRLRHDAVLTVQGLSYQLPLDVLDEQAQIEVFVGQAQARRAHGRSLLRGRIARWR